MAQNECQQMPKDEFYRDLRAIVGRLYNSMQQLERASEFLASIDAATATAMTIDSTTQTSIAHLRTAINEMLDYYDGTATTQTRVLKTYINQIRHI